MNCVVLIFLVPMLIPASACTYAHVPNQFRQFSVGTRRYRHFYVVFRYILTPILALPRDVYVLSQDINKFLSTKTTFPHRACF